MRIALITMVSFSLFSFSVQAIDDRLNVMECSEQEVQVYINQVTPSDKSETDLRSFRNYKKGYIQKELKKAEDDPTIEGCVSLLYGDLNEMYERMKLATSFLVSTMPDASTLIDKALEQLGDSICNRMEAAANDSLDDYADQLKDFMNDQLDQTMDRVGKEALNGYISDYVDSKVPEKSLEYRNGEVNADAFKSGVKDRWKDKMKDLQKKI
ncbi:MAG: hypothetical protein HAW67_02600 [Endozoicomonadaceae bacterium]|nr:hypothetical protein [Endozoicomonadaceae bacterium]